MHYREEAVAFFQLSPGPWATIIPCPGTQELVAVNASVGRRCPTDASVQRQQCMVTFRVDCVAAILNYIRNSPLVKNNI